jgi:hypothetical protein
MSKKSMAAVAGLLILIGVIVVVGGAVVEHRLTNPSANAKKSPGSKTPSPHGTQSPPGQVAGLAIRVYGNKLVDGKGRTVQLRGVNRSGAEYGCVRGDEHGRVMPIVGPTDAKSIAAIRAWHANVVRIPLNEGCWLGINGAPASASGSNYRNAIVGYVNRINAAGMYVILDLHWNAPDGLRAVAQQAMADADHSTAFWSSVAATFKRNRAVIFDLYNEPFVAPWNASTSDKWNCWLNGCTENEYNLKGLAPKPSTPWPTAGMQSLVNAVRATGNVQPVMLAGEAVASDFSGFFSHLPNDPAHQLIASAHIYNNSSCTNQACWQGTLLPVARRMPVVTTELGEYDCAHGFIDRYMAWSDSAGVSYVAWSWLPGTDSVTCRIVAGLITDWSGTPTPYGAGFKTHLSSLGG